eukprot:437753-Prymnesium_polylepis.1
MMCALPHASLPCLSCLTECTQLTGASLGLSSPEGLDRSIWRACRLPSRDHDRERAAHCLPSREALAIQPHALA